MKILVIGGTGMLGAPVVRALRDAGHEVRVMSRTPEKAKGRCDDAVELVAGEIRDAASIARALDGCSAVHISVDAHGEWDLERLAAEHVVKAGKGGVGLERITMITGASVCEENAWFPMTRGKLDAENAIRASGVPFTFFRCTMFMELLPRFVRNGKAMVMGRQPHPWHFLAANDYARMVTTAYATPESENQALTIFGPEALTMEQALQHYCAVCAPDAKVARVPFWLLRIFSWFPGARELRRVGLPLMKYFAKVPERGDPTRANEWLGAPTTTLDEWCRRQTATT